VTTAPFQDTTAWARNLAAPLRDFLRTESGGAVVLLGAAIAALVWANSPWPESYESVWSTELSIHLGEHGISLELREWVNQGLMTFFFLVVGLEAKRELDVGQLRERRRVATPLGAALGGMALPVLVYLAFNAGGDGAHGWGAAMSTDTAFALGLLALVAPGGTRLRITLLTMAVFDDLVALLVIATVYAEDVELVSLAVAAVLFAALLPLRYAPAGWRGPLAAMLGVAVWVALLDAGVDPVITGLAVGMINAAYPPARADLEQVTELARSFREQPSPQLARSAQLGVAAAISPNERLQYRLHPWTSFAIVPLFALANTGIHVDGELLRDAVDSPITLGIFFGYVVGKPLGILLGSRLVALLWPGRLPMALSWPVRTGGAVVAGIGFTISLLIAHLAFEGPQLEQAKVGVLASAVVAALGAWLVFSAVRRLPAEVRARQLARTSEDLVDLPDEVDPARDHIRGPVDAPVTLVEYGDYECPYCSVAEVAIREVLADFGDDIRYVWRHLPLSDVHRSAQMAAEAAEAAAAQGAFWPMHDLLITDPDELDPDDLDRYAEQLGLDRDRFWDDIRRHVQVGRVADDVASADASGVAGVLHRRPPSPGRLRRRHARERDRRRPQARAACAGVELAVPRPTGPPRPATCIGDRAMYRFLVHGEVLRGDARARARPPPAAAGQPRAVVARYAEAAPRYGLEFLVDR
jgi:Na+/H+ antiporter NhaA